MVAWRKWNDLHGEGNTTGKGLDGLKYCAVAPPAG